METIVDFSPESLKAPFLLRCAAFCVDYMLLLIVPVAWLMLSKLFGDNGLTSVGLSAWTVGVILFLSNFIALPIVAGRSIGKMLLGLTIVNLDGTRVGIGGMIKRNVFGYLATALTLGAGFLLAGANTSGRALHDFVGGTIVVHGRKTRV